MPADETRHVLKVFEVTVTAFADPDDKDAPPEGRKRPKPRWKLGLTNLPRSLSIRANGCNNASPPL